MKVKVRQEGVTVPRHMLGDAEEVEIRREDDRVVLEPIPSKATDENRDPILGLGENPVSVGTENASEDHDEYLYGSS